MHRTLPPSRASSHTSGFTTPRLDALREHEMVMRFFGSKPG